MIWGENYHKYFLLTSRLLGRPQRRLFTFYAQDCKQVAVFMFSNGCTLLSFTVFSPNFTMLINIVTSNIQLFNSHSGPFYSRKAIQLSGRLTKRSQTTGWWHHKEKHWDTIHTNPLQPSMSRPDANCLMWMPWNGMHTKC